MTHHAVGAVLGTGEHQRAVQLLRGQQRTDAQRQQRLLLGLVDEGHVLLDALGGGRVRGDFDAHRIDDELLAEVLDRLGHRRREEQALAGLGQQVGHALQRMDEAEVHHLVGFVEHEDLGAAKRQRALVDQVEQAARRGDKDVDARHQTAGLLAHRHATEHAVHRHVEIAGIALHVVGNLRGQLTRRREHQHAARGWLARLRIGRKAVQRRQRERCGLAGAGLRDAEQVAALQQGGDRLALDRRRIVVALGFEGTENGFGKAEFSKKGHEYAFVGASAWGRRASWIRWAHAPRRHERGRSCDPCVKGEAGGAMTVRPGRISASRAKSHASTRIAADCPPPVLLRCT